MKNIEISVTDDVTLVTFPNAPADICFVAKIFSAMEEEKINVDMISQTPPRGEEASISFTISDNDMGKLLEISNKMREMNTAIKMNMSSGNSKISVSGSFMRDSFGVAAKVFSACANAKTDIRVITTSEIDISMLVDNFNVDSTVSAITSAFEL